MKAWQLLSDRDRWTQGVFARDKDGNETDWHEPSAHSFCAVGALRKCYKLGTKKYFKARDLLTKTIGGQVTLWNDHNTHREVLKTLQELDI